MRRYDSKRKARLKRRRGGRVASFTPIVGFADGGFLNGEATFTRSSTANAYVDGVLTSFATNVPRFGKLENSQSNTGLVVEGAATNLLLQSQDLSTTWTSFASTETTNTTVAPDGTTTADTFHRSVTTASYIQQQISKAASAIEYTFSLYVHRTAGTGAYTAIRCQGTFPARIDVVYRHSTNAIVTSSAATFTGLTSSVETIDHDWIRLSATFTTDSAATLTAVISANDDGGAIDSTDSSDDATTVVWGMQLEANAFHTSYVPTTTGTATRAADVCSIASLGSKDWFNADEGTVFVEYSRGAIDDGFASIFSLDDGTLNERISSSSFEGSGYGVRVEVADGGVSQWNDNNVGAASAFPIKATQAYKLNDMAAVASGEGTVSTETSATVPAVTTLVIGDRSGVSTPLYGTITSLVYYPTRLSNASLLTLTAS